MRPGMVRSKMILAQPLYLRRNGGHIEGNPKGVLHSRQTSLQFLFFPRQPSRFFGSPPLFNPEAQIGDEKCQDDQTNQPRCRRFNHDVPGYNNSWTKP